MKKLALSAMLCASLFAAQAQTGPYNLSTVPETLKAKAAVITHVEDIQMEVESLDDATLRVHKVFTVLNEDGKGALLFNEYSSKSVSLEDAEIKLLDAAGKQTAKYKKKDMVTIAIGEGLVEDGYVTYYRVTPPSYPVTVEINYEQKFKSTLSFPDYHFIHAKEGVMQSSYTAKVPAEIPLRYKTLFSNLAPVITEDGKYKIYQWKVSNMAPVDDEEGSVSGNGKFPYVNIVASQFSHYGFKGDLSSWKSFGAWIKELYTGLDELPAERQQFFQQLVSDAPGEPEKIKRIYKYLQENFRYVSIQLGIGGLKPFSAAFTDQKKYGDCKALSNFMKAALKAVNIKSHVAIINSSYDVEPVDPDFPANNFNHVILCVPQTKDSIWLECTSSNIAFNHLGTNTENRNALLITENGGVLAPTPQSRYSANLFATYTTVHLDGQLSAPTETIITTKGAFSEMIADVLKSKRDEQKQMIVFGMGYKQPDEFELLPVENPIAHQTKLKLIIRKLPDFNAGSKYFISPRVAKIWARKLPPAENRKLDFYFRHPFEARDTTVIKLAGNFTPDALPKEKNMSSTYADYTTRSWYNEKEEAVYTATSLVLKKHKVAAADYKAVKAFFDEVMQDDAQRIVVKKSEKAVEEKKAF